MECIVGVAVGMGVIVHRLPTLQPSFPFGVYFRHIFIGYIIAILKGGSANLDATAETDGSYFCVGMKEMRQFLEEHPGFQLQMLTVHNSCSVFGKCDPLCITL